MKLPKQKETSVTGRLGVTILQEVLERKRWVFRRLDGGTDFGIDGEVEITDRNYVTGHIYKCQVKGTEQIEWRDDSAGVQVKISTFNLWERSPLFYFWRTPKKEKFTGPILFPIRPRKTRLRS